MLFEGLFIFELFILYLLSSNIYTLFFRFFYSITRNNKIAVYLLSLLFFPGTFLHEIAHWIMSILLFVSPGSISLIPKLEKNSIKFGSVLIEKTDPLRNLMIGAAPVFLGLTIIIGSIYFTLNHGLLANYWTIFILSCLVFEIGNTMFSSKKDMEGALELIGIILLVAGIVYLLGLRIQLSTITAFLSQPLIVGIFQKGSLYLLFPIIIDMGLIFILRLFYK